MLKLCRYPSWKKKLNVAPISHHIKTESMKIKELHVKRIRSLEDNIEEFS